MYGMNMLKQASVKWNKIKGFKRHKCRMVDLPFAKVMDAELSWLILNILNAPNVRWISACLIDLRMNMIVSQLKMTSNMKKLSKIWNSSIGKKIFKKIKKRKVIKIRVKNNPLVRNWSDSLFVVVLKIRN